MSLDIEGELVSVLSIRGVGSNILLIISTYCKSTKFGVLLNLAFLALGPK